MKKQPVTPATFSLGEVASWKGVVVKVTALREDGSIEARSLDGRLFLHLGAHDLLSKEPALNDH